jgi:hypothetical protein
LTDRTYPDWQGTPIHPLYKYHASYCKNPDDAIDYTDADVEWLLRSVLNGHEEVFSLIGEDEGNQYCWSPEKWTSDLDGSLTDYDD